MQALFPDNAYGVDSGGDPQVIPKLTFEEFKVCLLTKLEIMSSWPGGLTYWYQHFYLTIELACMVKFSCKLYSSISNQNWGGEIW